MKLWIALLLAASAGRSILAQADPLIPKGPPEIPPADRTPQAPTLDEMGVNAPLLSVDRFSDAAGTLLRRSANPRLPAAGEAFSLDDPRFAVPVSGPAGFSARCYDLDIRPSKPARYYVFYDSGGNYRLGQFPVIEKAPGDPGYSDLWDIWKITTPDDFVETNWVRDAATIEKLLADKTSGYTAASTGIYLNAPVVPEGTTAGMKAEGRGGRATRRYAWYQGKRAPYLYFEGSLRLDASGNVPVSTLTVRGKKAAWPPADAAESTTWPKAPGYSPLARVVNAKGKPVFEGTLNCPIVGTAIP